MGNETGNEITSGDASVVIGIPTSRYQPKNDAVIPDKTDGAKQLSLVKSKTVLTREHFGIETKKGDDGLDHCYNAAGKAICGAKLRNKEAYCQQSPSVGRNRCRLHGGASPMGITSARFSTGKYTRDIPSRLAQRYEEALKDDRLLELKDEIALIETRIGDLVGRVDSGESGEIWRMLKLAYNDLRKAAAANDKDEFAAALTNMGRIINKGQGDYAAWDEVFKAVAQNRRLKETERKRTVELQQIMTAEQAMSMLGFVVSTIKGKAYEMLSKADADKYLAAVTTDLNKYLTSNQSFVKG